MGIISLHHCPALTYRFTLAPASINTCILVDPPISSSVMNATAFNTMMAIVGLASIASGELLLGNLISL